MAETYDVVIVGSGAGGGMFAYVLARAGARVAMVEAGGHNVDHDLRHHQWTWELPQRDAYAPDPVHLKATTRVEVVGRGIQENVSVFDGNAHNSYYDNHFFAKIRDWRYTCPPDKPFFWIRTNAIGGRTNCWNAGAMRWGPVEWRPASYDGYGADWPVSYDEMAPWYEAAERLIGISGERCGQMSGAPDGEFLPPPGIACGLAFVKKAAARIGYIAVAQPRAIITRPHNGRSRCHYCGRCSDGCDVGAKFTSVGALLPHAQATGRFKLFPNLIVREVTVDAHGRASGVLYLDRYTGREGAVRGRYVVLAAGAIETARILLNSTSGRFPDGLANSSGQVGRNFAEDTAGSVTGYFPSLLGRDVVNEDAMNSSLMVHPFVNLDEKTRAQDFLRRYVFIIAGGFSMRAGSPQGAAGWGQDLKEETRRWYGSQISITAAGGGLEDPGNYVEIDPDVKDAWGIPAARIHFQWGSNQEAMVRHGVARATELIEAAGGVVLTRAVTPIVPGMRVHEQSTCRMGDDPRKFVTNRWGQCHDVPNLICGDGSCHTTSGITNPTVTLLTMALRNATRLVEKVRTG